MNGLVVEAREALEPIEPWDESRDNSVREYVSTRERGAYRRTNVPTTHFLGVGLCI